jgi:hypothetical protein
MRITEHSKVPRKLSGWKRSRGADQSEPSAPLNITGNEPRIAKVSAPQVNSWCAHLPLTIQNGGSNGPTWPGLILLSQPLMLWCMCVRTRKRLNKDLVNLVIDSHETMRSVDLIFIFSPAEE